MTRKILNPNRLSNKGLVNVGTPNKGNGDPIRTSFVKLNSVVDAIDDNFAELYNVDQSTQYHLGDDTQFVNIELDGEGVPTGGITIQSGFDTAMPIYIKGANALQDGVGGNVIIEAGAPPLAAGLIQGGDGYAGTVGDIEMSANQVTIETLGGTTTFAAAGYVSFPEVNGEQLGIQGNEIGSQPGSNGLALTAYNGSILLATHADSQPVQIWEFDRSGTINTPLLFPLSFTAVLDVEHRTSGGDGTYTGPAWEFNLEWQVSPSGQIELLSDTGPLPSLVVGYADGQTFEFTEADHGIPNYTLTVELYDVVHAGPAGWTANLNFSEPPVYPSTINTLGAIKLTSNNHSWTFDTGGYLNLPYGSARILGAPEGLVLDGNGAPGSSNLTLLEAGAFLTSQVDITLTTAGGEGGNWVFDTDGNLTLPVGGIIKDSNGTNILDGLGGGGVSISDFGEGFSLTAANKIVTNKLYSTNLTQPTQHYRLELDTNGVVHLPDQSMIMGATLKSVAGNYAALMAGPVGKDEDSQIWVDPDGAWIGTKYNTSQKLWQFDNNGTLTFPDTTAQTTAWRNQLSANLLVNNHAIYGGNGGNVVIRTQSFFSGGGLDPTQYNWTFGDDGTTTFPGSLTVEPNNNSPIFRTNNDFNIITDSTGNTWTFDSSGILTFPGANGFRATFGSVEPVGDVLQTINSLLLSSEAEVCIRTDSASETSPLWTFGVDGSTTFPNNVSIKSNGAGYRNIIGDDGISLSLVGSGDGSAGIVWDDNATSPTSQAAVSVNNYGIGRKASATILTRGHGNPARTWKFDEDGNTTFPNGIEFDGSEGNTFALISGAVSKIDLRDDGGRGFYTDNGGFNLRSNGTYTWNFGTDGTLTVPGDITSTAGVGDVVIEANNGTLRTWTFGADGTLNLPTTDDTSAIIQALTHIKINADGRLWSFASDGHLTIPDGGDIKNIHGSSVLVSTGNIRFDGTWIKNVDTGNIYISPQDGNTFLTIPSDTQAGIIPVQLGNIDANGVVQITAGDTYKNWTFNYDGTLTLPAGGDIVDGEGETVLGFASTSYSLSDVATTILEGPTTSGVTVTGDATATFPAGTEIQFESIAGAEFTVASSTYNSGDDTTTIIITDYTGFGPCDGDKIYIEYHSVQEIYAGSNISLGVTEGNSGRVLTIAATTQSSLANKTATIYLGEDGTLTLANSTNISDDLVTQYTSSFSAQTNAGNGGLNGWFTSDAGAHPFFANPLIDTVSIGWYVSGPGLVGVKQITNIAGEGGTYDYAFTVDLTDGSTWNGGNIGTYTFYTSDYSVVSKGTKLTVNSNNWTFGTDGKLTVPGGMDISQSITWPGGSAVFEDSGLVLQGATGLAITSPGTTQITAGSAQWNFINDGSLTLPNNSTIKTNGNNSIAIVAGPNANATAGLSSNDELSWMWVAADGAHISAESIGAGYGEWKFGTDGTTTLPAPAVTFGPIHSTVGSGTGGTFHVTVTNGVYSVTADDNGTGYGGVTDPMTVPGDQLGGLTPDNDLTIIFRNTKNGGWFDSVDSFSGTAANLNWKFGNNGTLTFPDSTVQTSAYTGILNDLIDVDTATPTNGDVLQYNSTLGIWQHNQLVTGSITLKGTWDANTNTPTLTASQVGAAAGWEYLCTVSGTLDLGLGSTTYNVGDLVLYDGTNWNLIPGAASVVSFNTRTGAITLSSLDVTTALGYTPLQSSDLSGYATTASLSSYATTASLSSYVTGTPWTSQGYLTSVTPSNFASQTANRVLAAPNGADGTPTFRALVAADIPTLSQTMYLGTTAVAINRASATGLSLAGVSIDGSAGSVAAANITGSSLPSGLSGSSLTSVGTLNSLTVSGTVSLQAATTVKDVRDTVYAIASGSGTSAGTITPDCANGNLQTVTLTGSITLNAFANPVSGQSVTIIVTQPSSGGPYTLTSSMKFANGNKTLSTAANAVDMVTVSYIGSTYYASLITGFA